MSFDSIFGGDQVPVVKIATDDQLAKWKILVVDDDESVHEVTKIALAGFSFQDKELEFFHCYSAAEAKKLLKTESDFALALIDVVMEKKTSGLELVQHIRTDLKCKTTRLVLRTGQPGAIIEHDVIREYDINDYKEKSELTTSRLQSLLYNCLRSYKEIVTLEVYGKSLEGIIKATRDLFSKTALQELSASVLGQIGACFGFLDEGMVCFHRGTENNIRVIGATKSYSDYIGKGIDELKNDLISDNVKKAIENRESIFLNSDSFLFLPSGTSSEGIVYFRSIRKLTDQEIELLSLFTNSMALGFDNVRLFEKLEIIAFIDPITELATRPGLFKSVMEYNGDVSDLNILSININNFQRINKLYGFKFGDKVLREFAAYLNGQFTSPVSISRFSRDHFVVVFRQSQKSTTAIASLHEVFFNIDNVILRITVNGGLADIGGKDTDQLSLSIQRANFAEKQAALTGGSCIATYDAEIEAENYQRVEDIAEIKQAIKNNEFFVYYQPKIDITDNKVIGAEALVRWITPEGKIISPGAFLPTATDAGLLFDIDKSVMSIVAGQQVKWLNSGKHIPVSVNISPSYINDEVFLTTVKSIFVRSDLPAKQIEFEILEESIINDINVTVNVLKHLRDLGFETSLDDFGTGYSSLSSLSKLPLDTLKADQSFMKDIDIETSNNMLSVIANVAKSFSLKCIVEGVETPAQLERLKLLGDVKVQGYLFAKPMPEDVFLKWYEDYSDDPFSVFR